MWIWRSAVTMAVRFESPLHSADYMLANTLPFNLTHHPAMNVPCGMSDGLPVGMMLVGRCHAEPTIYRAAYAFEQTQDWKAA